MDLSLVPQEDLVKEIQARNDVVIMAWINNEKIEDSGYSFRYSGGSFASIGLCDCLGDLIRTKVRKNTCVKPHDGDQL